MKESRPAGHLIVKKKGQVVTTYTIRPDDTVVTIGRHSTNDVNLTGDTTVSRIHAAIVRVPDSHVDATKGRMDGGDCLYLIRDLGSVQGTKIGKIFLRKRVLTDGDTIQIGSYALVWNSKDVSPKSKQGLPLEERFGGLAPVADYTASTLLPSLKLADTPPLNEEQAEFLTSISTRGFSDDFMESPGEFLLPLMKLLSVDKALIGCHEEGCTHLTCQRGFDRESPHCSADFLLKVARERSVLQEGAIWSVLPQNGFVALFRTKPPAFCEEDMAFMRRACETLATTDFSSAEADVSTPWLTPIVGLFDLRGKCLQMAEDEDQENGDVLLLGESGTGKEVLARFIHEHSSRRDGPFITANCSSLPHDLVYAELFGYEKGAFSGAVERKAGYLEMAHGGTLFLDEIGDMPDLVQVALLTALQQRRIQRLGAKESLPLDIRVIGATDQDVIGKMRDNAFRRPLYERFVHRLNVPPLRERIHEIPLLAYYFLDRTSGDVSAISRDALQCLRTYDWPGNVRELKHIIKVASTGKKGFIFSWDLPDKIRLAKKIQQVVQRKDKTLKEMERDRIVEVLEETRGSVGEAIRILGISRATLYNKVKEYGLQTPGRKAK